MSKVENLRAAGVPRTSKTCDSKNYSLNSYTWSADILALHEPIYHGAFNFSLVWNDALVPMSSSSVDSDNGAEGYVFNGDVAAGNDHAPGVEENGNGKHHGGGRIAELLQEERDAAPTPQQLGNGINRYKNPQQIDSGSEDGLAEVLPRRAGSPLDSTLSIPDDSPSVQVSRRRLQ